MDPSGRLRRDVHSGINSTFRQVGIATGVAALGAIRWIPSRPALAG